MAGQLFTFYSDGYTHGDHVYLQGEMVEVDTERYPHFLWDADDQMQAFGKVFWKPGPWDGPLFDTEDVTLTPAEREKLEEANERIIEARENYKPSDTELDEAKPVAKAPVPKRKPRTQPSVVVPNKQ